KSRRRAACAYRLRHSRIRSVVCIRSRKFNGGTASATSPRVTTFRSARLSAGRRERSFPLGSRCPTATGAGATTRLKRTSRVLSSAVARTMGHKNSDDNIWASSASKWATRAGAHAASVDRIINQVEKTPQGKNRSLKVDRDRLAEQLMQVWPEWI